MAVFKWGDVTSQASVLTTELNSLADGANVISALLSNDQTAELDTFADFVFTLAAQGSARDAGAYISLYILPEVEGSVQYGDASTDPPSTMWCGSFAFDAATTARIGTIRGVLLPPDDFYVLVMNETGQALASTGNILDYRTYNVESS